MHTWHWPIWRWQEKSAIIETVQNLFCWSTFCHFAPEPAVSQLTNLLPAMAASSPNQKPWVLPWLTVWLPVVAFLPLSSIFMMGLLNRADYEFFPLHLAAVILLMVTRSRELGVLVPRNSRKFQVLLSLWWLAAIVTTVLVLDRASFLMGLVGLLLVAWRVGGWPLIRAWWPCALLVLWVVPPPFGLLDILVQKLQGLAVRASHHLLMLRGILHGVQGQTIYLPDQSLFVSEACSGVRSLVTLGAFSSVWSLFLKRGWIHGFLLVGLTLGWVLVLNAMRIVVITIAATRDIDLLNGWPHTAIGLAMFVAGVALIGSTDALLGLVRSIVRSLLPERRKPLGALAGNQGDYGPTLWPKAGKATWGPAQVAALWALLILQATAFGMTLLNDRMVWKAEAHLPPLEGVLPKQLAGWTNELGPRLEQSRGMMALDVKSQQWLFSKGTMKAIVSMDDHFPGWHPLMDCYDFSGWKRLGATQDDAKEGTRHIAFYQKSLDENGFLVFGLLSQDGDWIGKPEFFNRYWITFINHMKGVWLGAHIGGTESLTRQVQIFVESPFPLNGSAIRDVVQLFEEVRSILTPHLWPARN